MLGPLETAMWWSRKSRIEAFAKRPDMKEALVEAAPISQEIDDMIYLDRYCGAGVWSQ